MTAPENQLNLRARHPDFQTFLDFNESESSRVEKAYPCHLDEKYGTETLQSIDVFPAAGENCPILVFIHGGYWKALDKKSYRFVAAPYVAQGMTVFLLNYRLIPAVNMEMLLEDIRDGIDWIRSNAERFNANPDSIVLAGHSAGGHLALMAYLMNEHLRSSIQAICSLSGIFDLQVIQRSYLNTDLQLTEGDVESFSVSNKDLTLLQCPTLLSVGLDETDLFIEQSSALYRQNQSVAPLSYYEYPSLNHYQIVHTLGQEDSPLAQFILQQSIR
ncbi:MAG: alpha/beta hydrolase [Saprospiraceae bacterium]|nr:alpha/beta hydrolase [Saprospiraceae bacterium]